MSTFSIPNSQGQIRQTNRGDSLGEIVESFNLDLTTSPKKIKTAKKLVKVLDESTHLSDAIPQAFDIYDGKYWALTDNNAYECAVTNDPTDPDNWDDETDIGSGGAIGLNSDMTVFGGFLLISLDTDILSWNGSADDDDWWSAVTSGSALTSGKPHIMHVHRGGQETLFVTDNNLVRYYNATAGHSTVTLQTDLTACCVSSGVSATWVGTYTESGTHAYVYEIYVGEQIDSVPVARRAYKVEGRAVLSIEVIDNIPYIVTEKGNLQVFNGAGFSTVATFPFAYTEEELQGVRAGLVQDSNTSRPVHPKGMAQHNQSILISIATDKTTDDYCNKSPSGIWEYNKESGVLNHRYAYCDNSTDYGERTLTRPGPIMIVDNQYTLLMAGGETNTSDSGVFMESADANLGYFVTAEIESDTIEDIYEALYLKAKTLGDNESIEMKWRSVKQDRQLLNGSFIDSTTFTTTDTPILNVGDEVTITEGANNGYIAHVISVSSGNTKTVELDTAIGTAGQTVRIEANNFKPIGYDMESGEYCPSNNDAYVTADGEVKEFGDFGANPWIQYKVVMKGDIEFRKLLAKGNAKTQM